MAYHYRGLVLETSDDVYAPAEDSILLADNVVVDGGLVLDMGCGCGIQALSAAKRADYVIGVDVNPHAVELAKRNASLNEITNVEFRVSDLFENVGEAFDAVIFNPPYLPVDEGGELGKAWSGGLHGTAVIERFIRSVGNHVNPGGRVFLLVSSFNNVDDILNRFSGRGFKVEVKARKRMFFEELCFLSAVYKC